MLKKEGYLFVEEYLRGALHKNQKWQKACDAAKKTFDDVVARVNDSSVKFFFDPVMQMVAERFFSVGNFPKVIGLNGQLSLREIFDDLAVLLEVDLEQVGNEKKGLEVVFNGSGAVVLAAII